MPDATEKKLRKFLSKRAPHLGEKYHGWDAVDVVIAELDRRLPKRVEPERSGPPRGRVDSARLPPKLRPWDRRAEELSEPPSMPGVPG